MDSGYHARDGALPHAEARAGPGTGSGLAGSGGSDSGIDSDTSLPDGASPESDGGPGTLEDADALAPATANCGSPVSSYTGPSPAPATWSDAEQACLNAASEGVDTRLVQNSCAGHVAYVVVGASALTSFVYERATGALVSVLGQTSLGYSCIAGQVNISKDCIGRRRRRRGDGTATDASTD